MVTAGPLLGPGYLLLRDAVSTPRSYPTDSALGLGDAAPRAVPQDVLLATLSPIVDGGLIVKTILLMALWAAGYGAAVLARELLRVSLGPQLVAVTAALWNPYVAERLLQGHWSLLTGYAALPWTALAAYRIRERGRRASGSDAGPWGGPAASRTRIKRRRTNDSDTRARGGAVGPWAALTTYRIRIRGRRTNDSHTRARGDAADPRGTLAACRTRIKRRQVKDSDTGVRGGAVGPWAALITYRARIKRRPANDSDTGALGGAVGSWAALTAYRIRIMSRRKNDSDAGTRAGAVGSWGALAGCFAVAGLTPTGALLAGTTAVVLVGRRNVLGALVLLSAASAPWLAATALSGAGTAPSDPAGIAAFAARAEPALGTLGSLAGLGGIWNADAVPSSRTTPLALIATALLLALVAIGIRTTAGKSGAPPGIVEPARPRPAWPRVRRYLCRSPRCRSRASSWRAKKGKTTPPTSTACASESTTPTTNPQAPGSEIPNGAATSRLDAVDIEPRTATTDSTQPQGQTTGDAAIGHSRDVEPDTTTTDSTQAQVGKTGETAIGRSHNVESESPTTHSESLGAAKIPARVDNAASADGSDRGSLRVGRALLVLAAFAIILPALGATSWGMSGMEWLVAHVPGAGLLRDTQKYVALAMPAYALCAAAGCRAVAARFVAKESAGSAGMALIATVFIALLVLPLFDLAWGVGGALKPVHYPIGWQRVAERIDGPGDIAVLPGGMFRKFPYSGKVAVLDPAPRMLPRDVLQTGELPVHGRTVAGEGARAREVETALLHGDSAQRLGEFGVGWVLVERTTPGPLGESETTLAQLESVYADSQLALYRVPHTTDKGAQSTHRAIAYAAHILWAALLVGGLLLAAILRPRHETH